MAGSIIKGNQRKSEAISGWAAAPSRGQSSEVIRDNHGNQGRGTWVYPNGQVYEGEWKAHKREGRGIERSANGDVYEGEYKAGKREGQGTYLCADGRIEVGFYKAGTRVGESVLWTADGRTAIQLQDGKWVKTMSLEEAERRVERIGLPMPVRWEGKWTVGQPV